MKIIDLINKIKNNEKVPEKVKFNGDIFTYRSDKKDYERKLNKWVRETLLYRVMNTHFMSDLLRTEVEVIGEKKEIEELPNELINDDWTYYTIKFYKKINELIRAVNKLNKEREEKQYE